LLRKFEKKLNKNNPAPPSHPSISCQCLLASQDTLQGRRRQGRTLESQIKKTRTKKTTQIKKKSHLRESRKRM
jgi:hypothetical protein